MLLTLCGHKANAGLATRLSILTIRQPLCPDDGLDPLFLITEMHLEPAQISEQRP